jgi:hypothetical protein
MASPRAFIRPDGGKAIDLNSLVTDKTELYLFSACSINSRGEIIGLALGAQGNFHEYLATPSATAEDPSTGLSAANRSARFDYAWSLASQRMGSAFQVNR